jgi:hypothetical protein
MHLEKATDNCHFKITFHSLFLSYYLLCIHCLPAKNILSITSLQPVKFTPTKWQTTVTFIDLFCGNFLSLICNKEVTKDYVHPCL